MQTNTTPAQPKKLLYQVRDKIRFKHYSLSAENTYLSWIKQFNDWLPSSSLETSQSKTILPIPSL